MAMMASSLQKMRRFIACVLASAASRTPLGGHFGLHPDLARLDRLVPFQIGFLSCATIAPQAMAHNNGP